VHEEYDEGAGDHDPFEQVEVTFEGHVDGYVTDDAVLVEHVPPLDAAPQAPEAAQPFEQEPYAYGVALHVPSLQVEDLETVEQAAPDGALDEYEVHEPPCAVVPQPPDAEHER
jgi:hypothetical protein